MSGVHTLVENVHLATMGGTGADLGEVRDGALLCRDGSIEWVGRRADLPSGSASGAEVIDGGGRWATPGLVDCHTHLVFGGNRANEFRMRLDGATYEEIARGGGGILSSVRATRELTEDQLVEQAAPRLRALMDGGVTTVEIKSGYGLDPETELRMLRVARRLGREHGVAVRTTLLGAHALPPEYRGRRDEYVTLVCEEMIPAAVEEGLADAVDAFCEGIAFTQDECRRVLAAGAEYGLALRLHADQLSDAGGAALAADLGAASADHLEYVSTAGVTGMAGAGTTAVLLPGAYYFLSETRRPPVEAFREHGVRMAVATDLNPGSSPLVSPTLAMNLACVQFGMTPNEAVLGMTAVAARVLGLDGEVGTLEPGMTADVAFWNVESLDELAYWVGSTPCDAVMRRGLMDRSLD